MNRSNLDSKHAGCYQNADVPRASECRNRWFDELRRCGADKVRSLVHRLAGAGKWRWCAAVKGLAQYRVAQAASGALAFMRATAFAMGAGLIAACGCYAGVPRMGIALGRLHGRLVPMVCTCIGIHVHRMHHSSCHAGVGCWVLHCHGVACQTAQGQQHNHDQGEKSAHGWNDTNDAGKFHLPSIR